MKPKKYISLDYKGIYRDEDCLIKNFNIKDLSIKSILNINITTAKIKNLYFITTIKNRCLLIKRLADQIYNLKDITKNIHFHLIILIFIQMIVI